MNRSKIYCCYSVPLMKYLTEQIGIRYDVVGLNPNSLKTFWGFVHVNVVTVRHYLTVGEEIGLCTYIRHDSNRCKTSIPLLLYDSNSNIVGSFVSAKHMAETMKEKDFRVSSINECARLKKPYKGYIIERITWEEFEQHQASI